ncbi:MAG: sugar phosphate isomerase/epimerase [Planctomycetes bacterium]|nr:sugar phosphate isomerase/epimerase [Planctomycetota bacterium]
MIWISYSTNAFLRFPVDVALAKIAALGFDGAEILCDRPHVWPFDDRSVARAARAVRRSGLRLSNVNINTAMGLDGGICRDGPGPALSDADRGRVEARVAYTRAGLRAARAIGAEVASVTTGPARRGAWKGAMDALGALAEDAAELGMRLGIEYEPGFLVGDVKTLLRAWRDVRHPALGANLDLGHARVAGEDLGRTIALCAGRTWNVHVEDIRGRIHYHLPVGDGDMPWGTIARALLETGYAGPLTVELYTCDRNPVSSGRRSLAALRRIFGGASRVER